MEKKHILVVCQYYFPEQFRINDITQEWVKKGYKVTVLTGIPNYPKGNFFKGYGFRKNRKENHEGVSIIRIPLIPRGNNSIMLALNYTSFVVSGFIWSKLSSLKVDKVFIYQLSPMSQALPGIWFSKRKKIPCDMYVLDLWPENFTVITGITSKFVIKPLIKMAKYIYSNCENIFISSPEFTNSIIDKGKFKSKLVYWPQFAEDFYKKVEKEEGNAKFKIVFAGNIGYAQGLDILPQVAKILKEKKLDIQFNLIGDGRYKNELIKVIEEEKLEDSFCFLGSKPAKEIPYYLSKMDVSLISLSKSEIFSITIPAKLQSTLACGHPIIVASDGIAGEIVKEANCGLVGKSGDCQKLVENIEFLFNNKNLLNEFSKNALNCYENNFSKKYLMDKMDRYI